MSRSIFLTLLGLTLSTQVEGTEPFAAEHEQASELLRRQRHAEVEGLDHQVVRSPGVSQTAAEACFREADRLRQQHLYPRAALLYRRSIELGGAKPLREQAFRQLYDIANYWLDDTRTQIRRCRELRVQWPDLWWVPPPLADFFYSTLPRALALLNLLHWDPTKPFFNEEGRALELLLDLEARGGPDALVDRALFLVGSVHFYREAYGEAEGPLTRLVQNYPDSALAPQALELVVVAKCRLLNGGRDEERLLKEVRQLLDLALRCYPELMANKGEWLERQLLIVHLREAERALEAAEASRRSGSSQRARELYEELIQSYPRTSSAETARARLKELTERP